MLIIIYKLHTFVYLFVILFMEHYLENIYKDNNYLPEEGDLMSIDELILLMENTKKT